jgi:hypothetical protein
LEFVDKFRPCLESVQYKWWPTLEFVDKFRPCLGECLAQIVANFGVCGYILTMFGREYSINGGQLWSLWINLDHG